MQYEGYNIVSGFGSMVRIKSVGRGALPKALGGEYTSVRTAKLAIDAENKKRGKTDGEKSK